MKIIESISLVAEDIEQLKKQKVIYADMESQEGTIQLRLVKESKKDKNP